MIKNYKHVIWDWNGTLLNDVTLCSDIMNEMLTKRKLPKISVDKYKSIFTFPVIEYYKQTGLDLTKDGFEDLSIEFISAYEAHRYTCNLYDDALEVLERIESYGIEQSVLSAYSQNALQELISHFNLKKYFVKLVGLDNIYAAGKIENGKKWMHELNHKNHEVLLIGDSVHDYEVAKAIGADSILIAQGHQTVDKLVSTGAKIINSLSELL